MKELMVANDVHYPCSPPFLLNCFLLSVSAHAYVPGQPSHLSGNKNSDLCCHS